MSSEKEFSLELKPSSSQELTFTDVDLQHSPSNVKKRIQIKSIIIGASVLILVGALIFEHRPSEPLARALWILERYPLIDGHNDLPWALRAIVKNNLSQISQIDLQSVSGLHTDLIKLSIGRVGGQFWSIYTPCDREWDPIAIQSTMEAFDILFQITTKYSNRFEIVTTAKGVREAFRKQKIASLIGVEGGHSINNSLSVLRVFSQLGARYMTLTHACSTQWAQSCYDEGPVVGLTEFGKNVVREMNRLGILVDLSHVSPRTMHDALDVTQAPVIFSHSSVKSLADHPRNVPDDVLLRLKKNGGVVGVNFYPLFICPKVMERMNYLRQKLSETEAFRLLRDWFMRNTSVCTIKDVVKHIVYIKDLIGIDHVGLGSDFDGVSLLPEGLENVSKYPNLVAELIQEGFSDDDIIKLIGGNFLRVLEAAEATAQLISN